MTMFGGVTYKPVDQMDLSCESDEVYISPDVKAPRMTGFMVKFFAYILECRIIGAILCFILKKGNLIHKFVSDADIVEPPVFIPLHPYQDLGEKEVKGIKPESTPAERVKEAINCFPCSSSLKTTVSNATNLKNSNIIISSRFRRQTILDYARAYKSREITPLMVAERFIAAVESRSSSTRDMGFFINYSTEEILRQASESTTRYKRGEPVSILDGVPIAVKDEIDCTPYPTTGGTKWLHRFRPCKDDAECVRRLRDCGALLVGKTNMHELGGGVSGINPNYGATRNPYNRNRVSGGSSSGSAALVSAGLCPVALGVDGGGSIRLPASLCGVVGLKPTFGRVSHSGVLPLNWTVGSVGVLSATIEDALIVYAAISGGAVSPDQPKLFTEPPELKLPLLKIPSFMENKITLVKYPKWFNDCSNDIMLCCSNTLEKLQTAYGWKTVDMTIPEIEAMRLAHYLTMGAECTASLDLILNNLDSSELGGDIRVALSIYGSFHSKEYIKAQKLRNRQMQFHTKIFTEADFIVTPSTAVTAYELKDDALSTGELDYVNGAALVRYLIAGNFLGLPAVSVPVGYDKNGLPIGLQFIGRPWSEPELFRVAFATQALCLSECRKPEVFFDLLDSN